jgi:poly-gamma-glutamate synthesis protein (capsule biosynthesis protein)
LEYGFIMGNRFRAFSVAVLALVFLGSCSSIAATNLFIEGGDAFAPERELLEKALVADGFLEPLGFQYVPQTAQGAAAGKAVRQDTAALISFEASWGETKGIALSRTWLIPREDPLAGRTNAAFAACLTGGEALVPLGELAPPYVGLTVEGLGVADAAYPLVKYIAISVREAPQAAGHKRGEKMRRLVQDRIALLEAKLEAAPWPLVQSAPAIVWITAAGDLMLGRGSGDILMHEGAQGILGGTAAYFAGADLGLVNLEGPVSRRGGKIGKAFNFRFDPATLPFLRTAGINAVLLANNHAFDFGETAFLDTLDHLEQNGIGALGAGRNIKAAAAPFIFTKDALTVQVFGIASYPRERSGWDGASVAAGEEKPGLLFAEQNSVERLKAALGQDGKALKVLLFHGGNEWTWRPDAATRRLYTGLAQSGADLIIGSHPHTAQGFEWVAGKPVFWSLGNYVFAGMDGSDGGEEGLLIRLGFMGKTLVYFEPVPVRLNGPRSDLGPPEQLRRFYALSREQQ